MSHNPSPSQAEELQKLGHHMHMVREQQARERRPGAALTVDEIERLAKAGVEMKMSDVRELLGVPDPVLRRLAQALARGQEGRYIAMNRFSVAVVGPDVYVTIIPRNGEPQVLRDDEAGFPSRELLTKMTLLHEIITPWNDPPADGATMAPAAPGVPISPPHRPVR